MKRHFSNFLSAMTVVGWGIITYNVAINLWEVEKFYSIMGALGCASTTLNCLDGWYKEVTSHRFWWSW